MQFENAVDGCKIQVLFIEKGDILKIGLHHSVEQRCSFFENLINFDVRNHLEVWNEKIC